MESRETILVRNKGCTVINYAKERLMHIKTTNCEGKNLYVSDFGKIIEPGKKKGPILNLFFFQWTIDYQFFTLTINLVLISRILE